MSMTSPCFPFGEVVVTPGAEAAMPTEDAISALVRHITGDWGDVPEEDAAVNASALATGGQILSAYLTASGTRFWIITASGHATTTILLPEEY